MRNPKLQSYCYALLFPPNSSVYTEQLRNGAELSLGDQNVILHNAQENLVAKVSDDAVQKLPSKLVSCLTWNTTWKLLGLVKPGATTRRLCGTTHSAVRQEGYGVVSLCREYTHPRNKEKADPKRLTWWRFKKQPLEETPRGPDGHQKHSVIPSVQLQHNNHLILRFCVL